MPALMAKCKTCGTETRMGLSLDATTFNEPSNDLPGLSTDCPNGHFHNYEKDSLYLEE